MSDIYPVETNDHKQYVKALYLEYLTYVNQKVGEIFEFSFDVESAVERDMNELHKLSPPKGRLLLVQFQDEVVGLGGLRQIGEGTGEIKRMFVRPNFRSNGVGRRLLERLIEEARQIGYENLRLDVGPYAISAEKLYRSAGFSNVEPYPESEVPPELHYKWQFMELALN